jgi:hypothetical protein
MVLMSMPVETGSEPRPAAHRVTVAPDVVMETDEQNSPLAYIVSHASRNTAAIGKLMLEIAKKPAPSKP